MSRSIPGIHTRYIIPISDVIVKSTCIRYTPIASPLPTSDHAAMFYLHSSHDFILLYLPIAPLPVTGVPMALPFMIAYPECCNNITCPVFTIPCHVLLLRYKLLYSASSQPTRASVLICPRRCEQTGYLEIDTLGACYPYHLPLHY